MSLESEIKRRRTFAIISHPDAGKTTLTEKFLLYGGAIAQAGQVKGKKNTRAATSDWMEIEKQRGISVTSSVMQFQYEGYCINILDTPGHQDFSEDTYRTLMAAGLSARSIVLVRNLQAVGDVKFPVALGILSQWIVGVGIAWLFGIYLGWGLVGIWMAFALDENLRAVLFIIRWKAGKWRSIKTV